ncbi:MAG: cbb3-type cytochrome c oxidase N-terminal domain-containing protein [Puniceicoccaceae bacterium]
MSTPKKPEDDKLRPHVYDGIQEYDNRLPNWWLWTFYGAVIFTVLYWFSFYNAETMSTDQERIDAQMAAVEAARLAEMKDLNNETLWAMSQNTNFTLPGAEIYKEKCLACHGPDLKAGPGLAGVSLVDDEWKWGNQPMSVYAMVINGSPDTKSGMQAWVNELGPAKVSQVVAYVLSYHTEQGMAEATTLNEPIGLQ